MSMDFYFSGQDALSLQEMIDFDSKREYDDYNSIDFELGASVPPLDLDENSVNGLISTSHHGNGLHMWLNGHAMTNSSPLSNSNYNLDFIDGDAEAAMMVDPHNVIPIDLFKAEPRFDDSPDIKEEPLDELVIKQEKESEDDLAFNPVPESKLGIEVQLPEESRAPSTIINKCKLKAKANIIRDNLIIPTNLVSSMAVNRVKNGSDSAKSNVQSMPKTLATIRIGRPDDASLITTSGSTVKSLPVTIVTTSQNSLNQIKIVEGSVKTLTPVTVQTKKVISVDKKSFGIHRYPKPAYSYSCLIAMALKNSKSGSLPVSEIYNFMCNHFPYFKTAPSGWKNSVRHNLSLNQCFEKIEKPMPNSGSSRKGCLWAMNPDKIAKMDAEVQKWSKKDPMAIKKAMVYPENLEALERGEMKVGSYEESEEYEEDLTEEEDLGVDAEDDVDVDVDDAPVTQTYLYNGAATAIDIDPSDMEVIEDGEGVYLTTKDGQVILNYNSESDIE